MEPGFRRGDILFLGMGAAPLRAGDIVVFNIEGRDIPIVHRAIKVHERRRDASVSLLTKGDNNYGDDRVLYAPGQARSPPHPLPLSHRWNAAAAAADERASPDARPLPPPPAPPADDRSG